jgi:hypothetical protein
MIGRPTVQICVAATITALTFVMAALGQGQASTDVPTLDRTIALARANNRETKRSRIDVDRQREVTAEARLAR